MIAQYLVVSSKAADVHRGDLVVTFLIRSRTSSFEQDVDVAFSFRMFLFPRVHKTYSRCSDLNPWLIHISACSSISRQIRFFLHGLSMISFICRPGKAWNLTDVETGMRRMSRSSVDNYTLANDQERDWKTCQLTIQMFSFYSSYPVTIHSPSAFALQRGRILQRNFF